MSYWPNLASSTVFLLIGLIRIGLLWSDGTLKIMILAG